MKLCQLFFVAALVAVLGCETKSPPGGDVSKTDKTTVATPENAFRLEVPSKEIDVHQGKTEKFEVELKRGKNFTQDVEVSFGAVPAGVTIEPATFTIAGNGKDDDQDVKITAAKDAPKGSYTITVSGKPKTGEATSTTIKVKVE